MITIGSAAAAALGFEVLSGFLASPAVGISFTMLGVLRKVRHHLPRNDIVEIRKEAKRRGGAYQSVVEGWFPG